MIVHPGPLGGGDQGGGDLLAGQRIVELHGPGGGPYQAAVAAATPARSTARHRAVSRCSATAAGEPET